MLSKLFNPDYFNVDSLESAKKLSLELDEYETWEEQTDWTIDILKASRTIDKDSTFVDWGVGVGRLSKAVIETFNCNVVGVDTSPSMLRYSEEYVDSKKYSTLTLDQFKKDNIQNKFTHAISAWSLQHSPTSQYDISFLTRAMIASGKLFIVDSFSKKIPKLLEADPRGVLWFDDGIKNRMELERWYIPLMLGTLPVQIYTEKKVADGWWALLIKKDTSKPV